MTIKAISRSNVLYGLSDLFKLDICAISNRSRVVHTNTLKTDFASVLAEFTLVTPAFNCDAGELYFKDKSRFIEIKNEESISSSLVQDGDTIEISTVEYDAIENNNLIAVNI